MVDVAVARHVENVEALAQLLLEVLIDIEFRHLATRQGGGLRASRLGPFYDVWQSVYLVSHAVLFLLFKFITSHVYFL